MIFTTPVPTIQTQSIKRQLSLRGTLRSQFADVEYLSKTSVTTASTILRLHRRVEVLIAPKADFECPGDAFMNGIASKIFLVVHTGLLVLERVSRP